MHKKSSRVKVKVAGYPFWMEVSVPIWLVVENGLFWFLAILSPNLAQSYKKIADMLCSLSFLIYVTFFQKKWFLWRWRAIFEFSRCRATRTFGRQRLPCAQPVKRKYVFSSNTSITTQKNKSQWNSGYFVKKHGKNQQKSCWGDFLVPPRALKG